MSSRFALHTVAALVALPLFEQTLAGETIPASQASRNQPHATEDRKVKVLQQYTDFIDTIGKRYREGVIDIAVAQKAIAEKSAEIMQFLDPSLDIHEVKKMNASAFVLNLTKLLFDQGYLILNFRFDAQLPPQSAINIEIVRFKGAAVTIRSEALLVPANFYKAIALPRIDRVNIETVAKTGAGGAAQHITSVGIDKDLLLLLNPLPSDEDARVVAGFEAFAVGRYAIHRASPIKGFSPIQANDIKTTATAGLYFALSQPVIIGAEDKFALRLLDILLRSDKEEFKELGAMLLKCAKTLAQNYPKHDLQSENGIKLFLSQEYLGACDLLEMLKKDIFTILSKQLK